MMKLVLLGSEIALLTACASPSAQSPTASTPATTSATTSATVAATPAPTSSAAAKSSPASSPASAPAVSLGEPAVPASPKAGAKASPVPEATDQPVRVKFPQGATSTKIDGRVKRYGAVQYILGAAKSQTMNASVTSSCKSVTLDIKFAENNFRLTDKPVTKFNGTLVSAGDYIVQVQNSDLPACDYTLSVDIQ